MIKKTRIPISLKLRSELQQEINSTCPFPNCLNTDIGHFQVHHIDEDPTNNLKLNLLLLCPNCHSKFTKKEFTQEYANEIKTNLLNSNYSIECANITIDSNKCSWSPLDNTIFSFVNNNNSKSKFPVLNFSLINHSKKTILLTEIRLRVKHLFSGLSGILNPSILKSSIKYRIPIPYNDEKIKVILDKELEIPSNRAFKFQIELYEKYGNEIYEVDGRKVLYFQFVFSSNLFLNIPNIFLNCTNDNNIFYLETIE